MCTRYITPDRRAMEVYPVARNLGDVPQQMEPVGAS